MISVSVHNSDPYESSRLDLYPNSLAYYSVELVLFWTLSIVCCLNLALSKQPVLDCIEIIHLHIPSFLHQHLHDEQSFTFTHLIYENELCIANVLSQFLWIMRLTLGGGILTLLYIKFNSLIIMLSDCSSKSSFSNSECISSGPGTFFCQPYCTFHSLSWYIFISPSPDMVMNPSLMSLKSFPI